MKNDKLYSRGYLAVVLVMTVATVDGESMDQVHVANYERWGGLTREAPILLVRADSGRTHALRQLLQSLAQVRGVHEALLLVVHAPPATEHSRTLVREVRFCKTAQIEFPHSVQPPHEPKLLWWWAARWVFERAPWAGGHRGPVVFLESGQAVVTDALHMLYRARSVTPHHVVALGRPAAAARRARLDLLVIESWRPSFAAGLTFDRTIWQRLVVHDHLYCGADDASWSHSLARVFASWGTRGADMVACAAPRVLRTSRMPRGLQAGLFPVRVRSVHVWGPAGRVHKTPPPLGAPVGDWPLDSLAHRLCLNPFGFNTTHETVQGQHTYSYE